MTTLRKFAERLERQANDGHHWDQARGMLKQASEKLLRLRDALIYYGSHTETCNQKQEGTCTCGYAATLLKELP